MGLNIDGVTKWSYGNFNMWRAQIARHEGFELHTMDGFGNGERSWDTVTTDLKPLLSHEDDSGVLTPAECAAMHRCLREVVEELWPEWEYDGLGERQRGLELADAIEWAAENDEDLEFN